MTSQSQPKTTPKRADTKSEPAAAFTPGPWIVRDPDSHLSHAFGVVKPGGGLIATVGNLGATSDHAPTAKRWRRETPANANLIAASPDLFESLNALMDDLEAYDGETGWLSEAVAPEVWNAARAAIAKATGGAS